MKTTCKSCGKTFDAKITKVGDPLFLSNTGELIRCQKESVELFCEKCKTGCKVKDGRP